MSDPAPSPPSDPDLWGTWDSFLKTVPETGFMQSSWWAEFRTLSGYRHFGIVLRNRDGIVGGAVVMKYSCGSGTCFYYIPEGPVLPGDEEVACQVFRSILDAVEERRRAEEVAVSHLRIEPRWQRLPGFVAGFRTLPAFQDAYMEPRDTLCIDLRPEEAEILAQMKPKGRYNIGVARRRGVAILEDASGRGIEDFIDIYQETAARQGLRPKPPEYFRRLISMLSALRQGSVFFAEYRGVRIAAAVVVYFGGRATYFFGGSLSARRNVMAPYLLHFEIMRRARAMGHDWYDLWGIAPAGEEDHPWRDISSFKRKFGGREIRLVPTSDYVFDPAAYEDYVARGA